MPWQIQKNYSRVPQQKPQQLPNAETNFNGCLITIVGREFLTPYFMKTPYTACHPFSNSVPKSISLIGGLILINNSTILKQEQRLFQITANLDGFSPKTQNKIFSPNII